MRTGMIFAAALAAAIVPQVASAGVVITDVHFDPGGKTTDISYSPAGLTLGGVYASRLQVTGSDDGAAFSIYAYCLDIFDRLNSGNFTQTTLGSLVPDLTRQSQIVALFSNANIALEGASGANARATISAATQMALWELAYEGNANYNVKQGQFDLSGGTGGAARTLANQYLGNVVSGAWKPQAGIAIGVLHSDDWQDLIYLKAATPPPIVAVPEPATWAMMILGMGAVGASMRRRRKVRVAFA